MPIRTRTRRTCYVVPAAAAIGFGTLVWYRVRLARQATQAPRPLVQVIKPAQLDMRRKLVLTAESCPSSRPTSEEE